MKQQFFVFVKAKAGHAHNMALEIAKSGISHIKEVSSISGSWDVLLRVEIDVQLNVSKEVISKVTAISGVKKTKTLVGYATYDPKSLALDDDFD